MKRFFTLLLPVVIFLALAGFGSYQRFVHLEKPTIAIASTQWVSQVGEGLIGPACSSSACTSAANSCGMTAAGQYDPNHQTIANCDAVTPSNSLCPPADCNAVSPQCLVPAPNPAAIFPGGTVTLTWNCPADTYVSSQGSGFSTGGALTGSVQVSPSVSTTYGVRCTTSAGAASNGSVAVTVVSPNLSIVSSATRVHSGDVATITWSATGVTAGSCRVTANALPISWTGESGSQQATITAQTIFTLTCSTAAGTVNQSTTVNLVPSFQEI